MTLDEIIAGMEHSPRCLSRQFCTGQTGNVTECLCPKCHLESFRAELVEMIWRWNEERAHTYASENADHYRGFDAGRFRSVQELRAKIGGKG